MRIAGGVAAGAILIVLLAWMEWLAQGGGDIPDPSVEQTVTAAQAEAAALAAIPGIVEGVLFERHGTTPVYYVVVLPTRGAPLVSAEVDATSGKVMRTEPPQERPRAGRD